MSENMELTQIVFCYFNDHFQFILGNITVTQNEHIKK